ncbi:MAG: hypothetical protein ACOC44_12415 [Promethearchaeia archaeon]
MTNNYTEKLRNLLFELADNYSREYYDKLIQLLDGKVLVNKEDLVVPDQITRKLEKWEYFTARLEHTYANYVIRGLLALLRGNQQIWAKYKKIIEENYPVNPERCKKCETALIPEGIFGDKICPNCDLYNKTNLKKEVESKE